MKHQRPSSRVSPNPSVERWAAQRAVETRKRLPRGFHAIRRSACVPPLMRKSWISPGASGLLKR